MSNENQDKMNTIHEGHVSRGGVTALRVLDTLKNEGKPLKISDLYSKSTGMSESSFRRLLRALEEEEKILRYSKTDDGYEIDETGRHYFHSGSEE